MDQATNLTLFSNTEENIKTLKSEEISSYLDRLSKSLTYLSIIRTREGDKFVAPYLSIIQDTIECLILKHKLSGLEQVDFSLTIDPSDSGFPTQKDFYLLEKNKEQAASALKTLPKRQGIIEMIRDSILTSASPAHGQVLLQRHNFFSKLSKTNILKSYHLNEPKFLGEEKNGRRIYSIEWSCIERGTNMPVLYRLCLHQNQNYLPLHKKAHPNLETEVLYSTQYSPNLVSFARDIDNGIEELHPKMIERYRIGPFYNSITNNSKEISSLLHNTEEPDPFILKFSVERASSMRVSQYGNWIDKLRRKKTEREVFGPVILEKRIIVPFRVKQELGNKDEYGNPCKVYGVTKGGNILD